MVSTRYFSVHQRKQVLKRLYRDYRPSPFQEQPLAERQQQDLTGYLRPLKELKNFIATRIELLSPLNSRKIQLSLDDFGAGYSSALLASQLA